METGGGVSPQKIRSFSLPPLPMKKPRCSKGAPSLSHGQEFRGNGGKHEGIGVFCPLLLFRGAAGRGRAPLALKRGPALIPRSSKAGTPGDPPLLLLPSPNFLALEVVAGALPRPICKRMKRKGEKKGIKGRRGGPQSGGGGGGGDGGEWIPPGSSMLRQPRLTKRSRGKFWGWWEAQSLRRIPGEIWELAPSSRWPQHRTRHRTPNLLLQLSRTRSAAGSARVFLRRQEKCPGKGFFPAAKNILTNFWLYFNFGVPGAVAGGGCSFWLSPRRNF